ncbi:MAG TPA: lipoyl(octanoyl) transferase [Leptospiraceae bacterium]|nr:lipoyl(octanoyl) transferase [Spirochaetaceae bacterium]HBS04516.1 lipoyl(octanoyl) transferase [Leptospiraceae bacterium]|tara:strand:- start:126384 stop:127040 length:657 start_codon:yes stop_codon:yes gene_type:complete
MMAIEYREELLPYSHYQKRQEELRSSRQELLLFCQHPPTITGGIQWKEGNLLRKHEDLQQVGIPLIPIKRGGDLTAHEPGQLVVYPHIDLKARKLSLSDFFKALLSISATAVRDETGVELSINSDYPGLYHGNRKVCAIGVEARSFFTSSGVAINVNNDLSTFQNIVACGLNQFEPGSVRQITGKPINLRSLADRWAAAFQDFLNSDAPDGPSPMVAS